MSMHSGLQGLIAISLLMVVVACNGDDLPHRMRAPGLLAPATSHGDEPIAMTGDVSDEPQAGDPEQGQRVYARCNDCHELTYSRIAPRHCDLIGRRSGTLPGYDFSDAMTKANIIWNRRTLNRFLADPQAMVPGTTMGNVKLTDARQRADVIAYLQQVGRSSVCTH